MLTILPQVEFSAPDYKVNLQLPMLLKRGTRVTAIFFAEHEAAAGEQQSAEQKKGKGIAT